MGFSDRLKLLREQKGLSQEDLAIKIKTSRSALSLWELGMREPKEEMFQRIADFFGVSVDYLLGRTGDPRPAGNNKPIPAEAVQLYGRINRLSPEGRDKVLRELEWVEKNENKQTVKESSNTYGHDLDSLLPRNEVNLAEALVKISEIAYFNKLTEQEIMYLHKLAVDYYGKPVFTGKEGKAALGPKLPGQIRSRKNP